MSPFSARWLRSENYRRAAAGLLVLTLLLNLAVATLLILTRMANADYAACTARWQQDFSTAYTARLDSSLQVQTALDEIVAAVDAEPYDPAQVSEAVNRYVDLRAEQDSQRTRSPFPPLPEQLCGTPARALSFSGEAP